MAIQTSSPALQPSVITKVLGLLSDSTKGHLDIIVTNTSTNTAVVDLFISTVSSPTAQHTIAKATLSEGEQILMSCLTIKAGEALYVRSTTSSVAIRATTIEGV